MSDLLYLTLTVSDYECVVLTVIDLQYVTLTTSHLQFVTLAESHLHDINCKWYKFMVKTNTSKASQFIHPQIM